MLSLAGNLHRWRKRRALSQLALAERSGLTQAGISQLEHGRRAPTLSSIERLANALGISQERLIESAEEASLSRERVDRIAHCILRGTSAATLPPLSLADRKLAEQVGALVIQKLRAHGVPGGRLYAHSRWRVLRRSLEGKQLFGEMVVNQILHRVDSLLAMERGEWKKRM